MAQSFSNQVLILLKHLAEKSKFLLDRQPKRVHAMAVTPVSPPYRTLPYLILSYFSLPYLTLP